MSKERKEKTGGFLKTSLAELMILFHAFAGGNKDLSGKEGTSARFLKTKLHFLTTEDEVIESTFIAKNLEVPEREDYRTFKETLESNGYDSGFFRVHLANRVKNDVTATRNILAEILAAPEWEAQEKIAKEYYLLKKKNLFSKGWENRWFVLYCVIVFLIFLGFSIFN